MAWTDFIGGLGHIQASPYDSARFGYRISRLSVGTAWQQSAPDIESLSESLWSRVASDDSDIVIVRYPSELAVLPARGVLLEGWKIVPAGALGYWALETSAATTDPVADAVFVREGESVRQLEGPADAHEPTAEELLHALADSFAGYISHYSANPLFDPGLATAGYREWAETTLRGRDGQVYGMTAEGSVVGVGVTRTLRGLPGAREFELAGMVPGQRGKGRYRQLIQVLAQDAAANGIDTIYSSTQSHNTRAQRAWMPAGFQPVQSIDTLHAVRGPLLECALR